jgi:hypothetical protein
MITTQAAALAAIRSLGYLNYFSPSPAESWFSAGHKPGEETTSEDDIIASAVAFTLIDTGQVRYAGSRDGCCWYREQRQFSADHS